MRAVVRLSGPSLPALLLASGPAALLAEPIDLSSITAPGVRRAVLRLAPGAAPLPVLALLYPAPRSFTGEHSAEFLVPGSPLVVQRVIAAVLAHEGVRHATPGEFSARAYLAGRLTLAQAEGIAATIAARSDAELAAAEDLHSGVTGRRFGAWADELATLLALVEAGIDFTDQDDVVAIAPGDLAARLDTLVGALSDHLGAARGAEHRDTLAIVALAGPPNAGKSTLFNALLRRRRAVVSPIAGTTRDVLSERLELADDAPGAEPVMLLDLAGLDADAQGTIDRDAQARARDALAHADVIVHCDPTGRFETPLPPAPGDRSRSIIRARTKADLLLTPPPSGRGPGGGRMSMDAASDHSLPLCSLDGTNLAILRRAIADAVSSSPPGTSAAASLLPRHRRALTVTLDQLRVALAQVDRSARALASPELVAGSLRGALDSLSELTGQVTPDDIIGRVFATFCVGK